MPWISISAAIGDTQRRMAQCFASAPGWPPVAVRCDPAQLRIGKLRSAPAIFDELGKGMELADTFGSQIERTVSVMPRALDIVGRLIAVWHR